MRGEVISCELVSADIPTALQLISQAGLLIENVIYREEMTVRFLVAARDIPVLRQILVQRGHKLRVIRRLGLPQKTRPFLRHPLLLGTIFLLLLMTVWLPTRVLFVRVVGNEGIHTNVIIEKAEACGIEFGAIRGDVRSELVKNGLLEALPDLQWTGINTSGCVATISVRERSRTEETDRYPASGIVAVRDGVVRDCTVRQGTALCVPGQAVRVGELLISGLTDCSLAILVSGAEGEVFAETSRSLLAIAPDNVLRRGAEGRREQKFSLLIGKKRINFYNDSGILDGSCVKMYSEHYITLPGNFQLPVGIAVETVIRYETEESAVSWDDLAVRYAREYLLDHMVAGQILEERAQLEGGRLYAQYICLEMIGQSQYEEIAERDGENDGENS